jgi:hypothetical protein
VRGSQFFSVFFPHAVLDGQQQPFPNATYFGISVEVGFASEQVGAVAVQTNQFKVVVNGTYQATTTAYPSSDAVITVGNPPAIVPITFLFPPLSKISFLSGGDVTSLIVGGVVPSNLGFAFNAVDTIGPKKKAFAYYMTLTVYWTYPGGERHCVVFFL